MNEWIVVHLTKLSSPERFLLACLGGLLLPALLIWGLAFPAMERRDAAFLALARVQAEHNWLAQIQVEYASLARQANASSTTNSELAGLSRIETSLQAAELQDSVAELGNTSDEVIVIRFQDVDFVKLMAWLQGTAQEADYSVLQLQLTQGEHPGEVVAEIQLKLVTRASLTSSSP